MLISRRYLSPSFVTFAIVGPVVAAFVVAEAYQTRTTELGVQRQKKMALQEDNAKMEKLVAAALQRGELLPFDVGRVKPGFGVLSTSVGRIFYANDGCTVTERRTPDGQFLGYTQPKYDFRYSRAPITLDDQIQVAFTDKGSIVATPRQSWIKATAAQFNAGTTGSVGGEINVSATYPAECRNGVGYNSAIRMLMPN